MRAKYLAVWSILLLASVGDIGAAGRDLPLVDAVKRGDIQTLRALLQRQPEVNISEADGTTALHWAAHREDMEAADLLIRAGANVKVANSLGVTPLSLACLNGNATIIEMLLKAGADANAASSTGETPLMLAARTGKVDALKILLVHGADRHARDKSRGQTALMWAAAQGHAAAIQLLVEVGAGVNDRSKPPTGRAAAADRPEPSNNAATPSAASGTPPTNVTAIQSATAGQDKPPEERLWWEDFPYINLRAYLGGRLASGGAGGGGSAGRRNAGSGSLPGFTPLMFAVRAGHVEAVRALAKAGANVNDTVLDGSSALVVAVINGRYEAAAVLLEYGADPNADAQGWTPLHQLIWTRRPSMGRGRFPVPTGNISDLELVKLLVQHGANPNARQKDEPADRNRNVLNRLGATPFLLAAKAADAEMMRVLLASGADPLLKTEEGATPLMAAAGVGIWKLGESAGSNEEALEAVKLAWELGNDVNVVDAMGDTALHGAVHRGANEIVKFLVEKGAKLDVRNLIGWTSLTIGDGVLYPNTFDRHPETAALLRELGAKDPGYHRPQDLIPTDAVTATRPQ